MLAGEFSGLGLSEGKVTAFLMICCVIASTGGFITGYCIQILWGPYGILSRDSFLSKFYPVEYHRLNSNHPYGTSANYCRKNDFKEVIPLEYSFFLAAALPTIFLASYTTRRLGRRNTMFIAGIFFAVGSILSSLAQDLAMLFIGIILLGCGIGTTYQVVPIYLSEMAPTKLRGALNMLFKLNVTIGHILAHIVGYRTRRIKGEWGWRSLLGSIGIFSSIFTIVSFFIIETPNSLIERGHLDKGKQALKKIRGANNNNIESELLELVEAGRVAKQIKYPFINLFKRRNMPPLIITLVFQTFFRLFGNNSFLIYLQVVFLPTIGYNEGDASFYATIGIGVVIVISIIASMYFVDKIGRRMLLLEAGLHMFLSQFLLAIILGIKVKDHSSSLSHGLATFVVILICSFLSSFSWSWYALSMLISSEIFPLEIRSAGQSVSICVYFICLILIDLTFIPMLCSFKFGVFFFFSGWILVMSFFVLFFLPETKNVPIEDMMERVWKRHWFWKRFLDD